ncbi:MAG: AAA family ATPase [Propionicimonas sp.]
MGVYEDVLAWASGRPWWQQQALARLARGEVLGPPDFEAIATALAGGAVPATPVGGWLAGLVAPPSVVDEPVRILAVRGVSNVNRLAAGQELTFSPDGLTVVYGNNGSGKSGYARVIRSMVHTRYRADILPDVFDNSPGEQAAEIVFRVGSVEHTAPLGSPVPAELARVGFYDEHCGDTYLTTESEISYRPSAIQLLDDLATVCAGVRSVLETRRAAASARGALPEVDPSGQAGSFLASLHGRTPDHEIAAATACPPDAEARLEQQTAEVARLQRLDPTREKQRLSRLAEALRTVEQHLGALDESLGAVAQQRLAVLSDRVNVAESAAAAASQLSFADEPLNGVGSSAWQVLWKAAENYSAVAYRDSDFPHVENGAVCVLCQQPLDHAATSRLIRFRQFVTDTTARDASAARDAYAAALHQTAEVMVTSQPTQSAIAIVEQSIPEFGQYIQGLLGAFAARQSSITAGTISAPVDITAAMQWLRQQADAASDGSAAVEATGFSHQLTAAKAAERVLRDQISMRDAGPLIEAERARLASLASLSTHYSQTNTRAITDKVGELTRAYVTDEARDRFTRESDRLGLERVTFKATRASRGALLHKTDFLNAHLSAQLADVLSEGEQTALGFAGFLTEAHFEKSKSALVFDDPVSSLDHMRREAVAERIVALAEQRQIVVFTHDVAFTMELRKAADQSGVTFTTRGVARRRLVGPGYTSDTHPWTAQDAAQRIDTLRREVAALRRTEQGMNECDYLEHTERIAGHMSETWERIISQVLAEPLVDFRSLEVRVNKLRVVGRVTADDVAEYDSSYSRISGWASRHDRHPELNYTPPSVATLDAEIEVLDIWLKRVKKYQQ